MTAFVVFITAGQYSDRSTVPLVACCDVQVADAVKVEVEAEIKRLGDIAAASDGGGCHIAVIGGTVVLDTWSAENEPVRGVMATPRLSGFNWRPPYPDGTRYGGEVEVVIVEIPSIGPVFT
jgi:hypothetical protein